jgi:N-acetyl-anhydromuramyl-L-alanine amidase AmpD
LESIGYEIQKQIQEEQTTLLQEQIVLLQSLCEKITQELELPAQAIAGLGDLLFRVRGIIEKQSR